MACQGRLKKRIPPQEDQDRQTTISPKKKTKEAPEKHSRTKAEQNAKIKQTHTINEMKIMYNNADIFTSDKKRELIHMAQTHRPHLIAICEVKPKKGALRELHEFEFEDYKLVNQTNVDNKTIGRGIILLAHSSIQHLIVDVSCSINQVEFIEACVVEVRLSGSDMLLFACIYRSPTKTAHSDDNNNKLNSLIKKSHLQRITLTNVLLVTSTFQQLTGTIGQPHIWRKAKRKSF